MTQSKHHKSMSVAYQTQSEITSHHQPVCAPTTNLPLSLQSSLSRYHLPSLATIFPLSLPSSLSRYNLPSLATIFPLSLQSSLSRYNLPSLTAAAFGGWIITSPGSCIVQASLIHVCGLPACLLLLLSMVRVKVQHLDSRHSKYFLTTVRRRCLIPLLMLTAQVQHLELRHSKHLATNY